MTFTGSLIEPGIIILSKISQFQKKKSHFFSYAESNVYLSFLILGM